MSWSVISDHQSSSSQSVLLKSDTAWLENDTAWLESDTAWLESDTSWLESENSPLDDTVPTPKDNHQTLSLMKTLPFDISHLLSSNDPPSSQDAVVVLECVRLLDDRISRLDVAIADAPSLVSSPARQCEPSIILENQKAERADVHRFRGQVQSVNSYIRLVPPEIWQLIFVFTRHFDGVLVFKLEDPVYVIGRVCQQWRRTSLRCPQLWSRLRVYGSRLLDLPQCESRLRTVLERSCSVPLDFSFACGCRPDVEREMPETLISLLIQHSARWRSAQFLEMTLGEALLLGNVRGLVSQLKSITLELSWERSESERTDMITAFEIAPELSRVVLCGVPLGQVVLDSRTKQNLQYLRVGHDGAGEDRLRFSSRTPCLSNILEDYPELRNVDLLCASKYDSITWSEPPPLNTPRTVYANLTSLRVVESAGFNLISTPNLTDLDVGLDGLNYNQGLFSCVISLLQYSGCHLSSLHLHFAEWDEESMGVLLGLVPELETLSISSGGLQGSDEMMMLFKSYLYESEDGAGVRPMHVPRLRELCIRLDAAVGSKAEWTFVSRVFVDMVAMRAKCGLEVVSLSGVCEGLFPQLLSKDWEGQWKDMKERGLIEACVSNYS